MNLHNLNNTMAKVVKFATTLPPTIGLLTTEDDLPLAPILGFDGHSISHWVIHLQKRGSGQRPQLSGSKFDENGIAELGNGWKLARLRINDSQIQFGNTVVDLLKDLAAKLQERDPAQEN